MRAVASSFAWRTGRAAAAAARGSGMMRCVPLCAGAPPPRLAANEGGGVVLWTEQKKGARLCDSLLGCVCVCVRAAGSAPPYGCVPALQSAGYAAPPASPFVVASPVVVVRLPTSCRLSSHCINLPPTCPGTPSSTAQHSTTLPPRLSCPCAQGCQRNWLGGVTPQARAIHFAAPQGPGARRILAVEKPARDGDVQYGGGPGGASSRRACMTGGGGQTYVRPDPAYPGHAFNARHPPLHQTLASPQYTIKKPSVQPRSAQRAASKQAARPSAPAHVCVHQGQQPTDSARIRRQPAASLFGNQLPAKKPLQGKEPWVTVGHSLSLSRRCRAAARPPAALHSSADAAMQVVQEHPPRLGLLGRVASLCQRKVPQDVGQLGGALLLKTVELLAH